MSERVKRSGRTGGAGEQTVTTRDEGRRRGAKERLRGMSFAEQEEALRLEPEPEGKKKPKGLGGALKKIFGKKKDKAPKAAPLEMEIGGPTDVQRVPQPLERVMAHLGTDPEVAKLVRFDGMTLKLDRSALPQPDAETEVDPTKPKVGIPAPSEVLDLSTLPPARNSLDGVAENGGLNGYVIRATTKDGRAVAVKRPNVIYFPGEERPVCRSNKPGRAVKGRVRRGRWAQLGGCSWPRRGLQTGR